MSAVVEDIFVVASGGAPMQKVSQVEALAGCGLSGDRYCMDTGYWTGVDECQVTLIEAEDLETIEQTANIRVKDGQHRRNLVTRGIRLASLQGRRFSVGEAVLEYDRPRPPCGYIQSITQPGMTRALYGRSGICARVVTSGVIRAGDPIVVL
jgi:MOSC domain-containing protein YiiM